MPMGYVIKGETIMWLIFLLFCTVVNAQEIAVDVKSIDLPYTPEQKEVVGDFTQKYFEETKFFRKEGDVTVEQFLVKDDVEQDAFISTWALKEKARLETDIIRLQAAIIDNQTKLTLIEKALTDWGK